MNKIIRVTLAIGALLAQPTVKIQASAGKPEIHWEGWSDGVFARARGEHRMVLLNLGAGWCHWCHVMDEQTYESPEVVELINSKFVAVRVDQDSRPDLSTRYQEYGWPATILFDGAGHELAKRAGFIPPAPMVSMLQAFIDDPTPGPSVVEQPPLETSTSTVLSKSQRKEILSHYLEQYDTAHASWGGPLKFLDWDGVELALIGAKNGNAQYERMARETLRAQTALIDPAWGGVYQYSTGDDWKEPHFEKIMMMQAQNLRVYSLAYAQTQDASHLDAAKRIARYLRNFMTGPEGAFYASQDADLVPGKHSADYFALDDAARRKLGIPKIDKNVYARENGWAIRALAILSAATDDDEYLQAARRAAETIIRTRSNPGGGFRHGDHDEAGPYLGDTLAMGQAFLELHAVTGEHAWLVHAENCAKYIDNKFQPPNAAGAGVGFASAAVEVPKAAPVLDRDENVSVARFSNLLYRYTGNGEYRKMRDQAMRYLVIPSVAGGFQPAGILLADLESNREPLHAVVVGSKKTQAAKSLFRETLRYPGAYKRIEWWDPREGPLPNPDAHYPVFERPAVFSCALGRCAQPLYKPEELRASLDGLTQEEAEPSSWWGK